MSEEKKAVGRLAGRRRLIILTAALSLFLLSALSIVVFVLKVENSGTKRAKGTTSAAPVQETPPRSEDVSPDIAPQISKHDPAPVSPDLSRARSTELLDELSALLPFTRTQTSRSDERETMLLYDTATPRGVAASTFYIYLDMSETRVRGRLVVGYTLPAPLSMRTIHIDADGVSYEIAVADTARGTKRWEHLNVVQESVDLPLEPYIEMLQHVGNAARVRTTCGNGEERFTFGLSHDQLDAVRRMLRTYAVYTEFERNAVSPRRH